MRKARPSSVRSGSHSVFIKCNYILVPYSEMFTLKQQKHKLYALPSFYQQRKKNPNLFKRKTNHTHAAYTLLV